MDEMLRLDGITAGYGGLTVLRDVDLSVREGEVVALLGANGAGKSTLLAVASGLLRPRSGRVRVDGVDVTGWPAERLVRRGLAHVPERRRIFGSMTVLENLLLGAHVRFGREPRAAIDLDLERVLLLFPQLRGRGEQIAGSLSGGEQQMLAIGRGLMSRPRILLLDEPSLGLAPLMVREICRVIAGLPEQGCAVLLVEQNARAGLEVSTRGYVLEVGRVVKEGTACQLGEDPEVREAYLGARREARSAAAVSR